jgi:hypothetical protein
VRQRGLSRGAALRELPREADLSIEVPQRGTKLEGLLRRIDVRAGTAQNSPMLAA